MGVFDMGLPNQIGINKSNYQVGDLKYLGAGSRLTFSDVDGTWLRLGSMLAWNSRYSALLKNHKGFCVFDFPTNNSLSLVANITNVTNGANAYYINAKNVIVGGGSSLNMAFHGYSTDYSFSSNQNASLLAQNNNVYCSCVLGNTLMVGGAAASGATPGYSVSTNNSNFVAATSGLPASGLLVANLASNNSNLAVLLTSSVTSNGALYTTINGTAFTARTGTGGTNATISAAYWSPCANAFLYPLNTTIAALNVTADGYTQSAAILPNGLVSTPFFTDTWKTKCASSSTSTLILMRDGKLLRTTDGNNYSLVDPSSSGDYPIIPIPTSAVITHDGSRYIIYIISSVSGTPTYIYSEDDGKTWYYSLCYESTVDGISNVIYSMAMQLVNGKLLNLVVASAGGSALSRLYDMTGLIGSSAPPAKVGSMKPLSVAASGQITSYAYLKVAN